MILEKRNSIMGIKNIGLIIGDRKLSRMLVKEIENIVQESNYKISLILIEKEKPRQKSRLNQIVNIFKSKIKRAIRISNIIGIEKKYFSAKPFREKNKFLFEEKDVLDIDGIGNPEVIYFEPQKEGKITYRLDDILIKNIVSKVDVVVLMGFYKILRGKILTEPHYGALSFHGSDFRKYRGRPGGFFQFINDEDTIGCTLQQLTNKLDGGRIILCRHADISKAKTLDEVLYQRYQLYDDMLEQGLDLLSDSAFEPLELTKKEMGQLTFSKQQDNLENLITYWHNYYFKKICPFLKKKKVTYKS